MKEDNLFMQQRSALRDILVEGEQVVPSTTERIVEAVRQGPLTGRQFDAQKMNDFQQDVLAHASTKRAQRMLERRRQKAAVSSPLQPGVFWRNVGSVTVVIAIILASVSLFSLLSHMRTTTGSLSHRLSFTSGWSAAVIGQVEHGQMSISNFDLISGRSVPLTGPFSADNEQIDGVSHDGHNLLYHYSSSGHTYYSTLLPLPYTGFFYELNDENAGDALWMSDSRHVLIATNHTGIVEVDSQTGAFKTVAPSLSAGHLWFYRDGYLYYDYAKNHAAFDLWRVNISTGAVQQVTKTFQGHSYFLSPDGSTVFYADNGGGTALNETAIYTISINSDGSNAHMLLKIDATPIGFAADNTLELLQKVNARFQVVKLKPTSPAIDRVVLDNVAPGAIALCDGSSISSGPVCDENVALSPYGYGLLVTGLYANGSRKIWANDLVAGKQYMLQEIDSDAPHVQLPGWDRISVN